MRPRTGGFMIDPLFMIAGLSETGQHHVLGQLSTLAVAGKPVSPETSAERSGADHMRTDIQRASRSLAAIRTAGYGAVVDLDEAHGLLLAVEPRQHAYAVLYPSERWYQLLAELSPSDPIRQVAEDWAAGFQRPPVLVLDGPRHGLRRLARRLERWLQEQSSRAPRSLEVVVTHGRAGLRVTLHALDGPPAQDTLRAQPRHRASEGRAPSAQAALAASFLAGEVARTGDRLAHLRRDGVPVPNSVVSRIELCLERAGQALRPVADAYRDPSLRRTLPEHDHDGSDDEQWYGEVVPLRRTSRTSSALVVLEDTHRPTASE